MYMLLYAIFFSLFLMRMYNKEYFSVDQVIKLSVKKNKKLYQSCTYHNIFNYKATKIQRTLSSLHCKINNGKMKYTH